jgi:hypothetical protein
MKNVNRGRLELRTFDPDRDLASAEAVAAAVKAGKDPFAGRTGDIRATIASTPPTRSCPIAPTCRRATGAKAFP